MATCCCGLVQCGATRHGVVRCVLTAVRTFLWNQYDNTCCTALLPNHPLQAFVCVGDYNGHIGLGVKVAKEVGGVGGVGGQGG